MTELEAFLTEAETHIVEFLKTAEGTYYETEWFTKMTMAEKVEWFKKEFGTDDCSAYSSLNDVAFKVLGF